MQIKNIYDMNPEVAYTRDAHGRNGLGVAVVAGNWAAAIILARYCRVSPHAIDGNGESIFHLIPRGLKVRRPTMADFEEVRAENIAVWRSEEEREMQKIQESLKSHPDLKPPYDLLVKKTENLEREMFGNLDIFLAKYILMRYHVVLKRLNTEGHTPDEVARTLQEPELAEYYSENIKPYMIKRRLIQGLNENLVRDIANFL